MQNNIQLFCNICTLRSRIPQNKQSGPDPQPWLLWLRALTIKYSFPGRLDMQGWVERSLSPVLFHSLSRPVAFSIKHPIWKSSNGIRKKSFIERAANHWIELFLKFSFINIWFLTHKEKELSVVRTHKKNHEPFSIRMPQRNLNFKFSGYGWDYV